MSHSFKTGLRGNNVTAARGVALTGVILLVLAGLPARGEILTVNNDADSGPGSLRAIIGGAAEGDTIVFDPSVDAIFLTSGPIAITRANLALQPDNLVTINGNGRQIFTWTDYYVGSQLAMNNIRLTDGATAPETGTAYGGAFASMTYYNTDALTVANLSGTIWENNSAVVNLAGNDSYNAFVLGGALGSTDTGWYANSLIGDIANSTWRGNEASSTLKSLTSGSNTTVLGGAVASASWNRPLSTIGNISDSHWFDNKAAGNSSATGVSTSGLAASASASAYGGALSSYSSDQSSIGTVVNTDWSGNSARAVSDAYSNEDGTYSLAAHAHAYGGALSSWSRSTSSIQDLNTTTWNDNAAEAVAHSSTTGSESVTFSSAADARGGALSSFSGQSTIGNIVDSIWQNNTADASSSDDSAGGGNSAPTAHAAGGALSSSAAQITGQYVFNSSIGNIRGSSWRFNEATAIATGNQNALNTISALASAEAFGGALSTYSPSGLSSIAGVSNASQSRESADSFHVSGQEISDPAWSNNKATAIASSGGYLSPSFPYPETVNATSYGGALSSYGHQSSLGDIRGIDWQNNEAVASATGGAVHSTALEHAAAFGGALSSAGTISSTILDIDATSWSGNKVNASFVGVNAFASLAYQDSASASGGALSASLAGAGTSSIGNISASSWADNSATAAGDTQAGTGAHLSSASAYGGALSSRLASGSALVGDITESVWRNNNAAADVVYSGDAYSAFGYESAARASAYGGALSSFLDPEETSATASLGNIQAAQWSGNTAAATASAPNNAAYASAYGGALSSHLLYNSGGYSGYDKSSLIGAITSSAWEDNAAQATAASPHAYACAFGGALASSVRQNASSGRGSSIGGVIADTWSNNSATATSTGVDSQAYAYGGAIYSTALGDPLLIQDSSFTGNTATATGAAGLTHAGGGAVFIDTISSTQSAASIVALAASADSVTLFRGNSVTINDVTTANSIAFGRSFGDRSESDAILNVTPDAGGVIDLYDPISVDIDNGHSFAMDVSGQGMLNWGGDNRLDVARTDAASNLVKLTAGRVALQSDFTLRSTTNNLAVELAGGANGVVLAPDLTNRDQSLAIFDLPASFTVAGGHVLLDPIYAGPYFSGSKSWLLTNAGGATTPSAFTLAANDAFTSSVSQEGDNLYIVLGDLLLQPADPPTSALDDMSLHSNPNVRAASMSGALEAAWDAQAPLLDDAQAAAALAALNTSPQLLTGETLVNQGLAALHTVGVLADRAWQLSRQAGMPYGSRIDATNTLGYRPWAGYTWSSFTQDGVNGHSDFKSAMNGGLTGLSLDVGARASVSLYAADAGAATDGADLENGIHAHAAQAGAFATYALLPQLQIGIESGYARLNNDSARGTPFGGYTSSFAQNVALAGARLDFDVPLAAGSYLSVSPKIRYLSLDQDAIHENGANPTWALHTGSPSANSTITALETSLSHDFIFANGMSVTAWLDAEWRHQSGDASLAVAANLGNSDLSSTLSSTPQDRDAGKLGASLTSVLYSFYGGVNLVADLGYTATRTNNTIDHVYHAGINVEF